MGLFDWLFGRRKNQGGKGMRAVPGAMVASQGGQVVYNMLDPWMQQFMGRCVGAIKKAGIRAKGTGQFSIRLGDSAGELQLDRFWAEFSKSQDAAIFGKVVEAAKTKVGVK